MNTIENWQKSRVNLVTRKSTAELKEIGEELNSRAFLIAKLTQANLIDDFRVVADDYAAGKITMTEAQERFKEIGGNSPDEIARNLAARSRATAVLNTQRQIARGVGEWQVWMETKDDLPYVIYHANKDGFVRPSHAALDGKIFSKDDPFLQTHMPGKWDYNCRCWGEQITAKRAEKLGGAQKFRKAEYDAESGFMFNPANAFRENDVTQLKDRPEVVRSMEQSVRAGKIRKIGLIVESPKQAHPRAALNGLSRMTDAMRKIQPVAKESVDKAQWDPKRQPGYERQDKNFKENNPEERTKIPKKILDDFPSEIEVGKISAQTCSDAGFGSEPIPVTLEFGDQKATYGLTHNWQHHKEVFADPAEGERILRATLGNPNAQVSVTIENMDRFTRKLITFFDPKTKSYCVARYDEKTKKFQLMSWHRSPASYGENQWEISAGRVLDRERQKEYWRERHEKK